MDDIPEYLRRHPLDPAREATIKAAWDRRWAAKQLSIQPYKEDNMVSLARLDLSSNPFPDTNLGRGMVEARVLTVGDNFVRFEVDGTPRTTKRKTWDAIPKEIVAMNVANTETSTNGTEPSTKKPRRAKKAAEKKAPAKKAAKASTAKKQKAEGKPTNKSVMLDLFRSNVGKPLSYEKLCMAVYGIKDFPGGFGGVFRGCEIAAKAEGHSIKREGRGTEATYTYQHKKAE